MYSLIPAASEIIYRNPVLTGNPRCAALFSGGLSAVEDDTTTEFPDAGFLLGTGDAASLYWQNGTETSSVLNATGDSELAPGVPSHDACALQFEFQCTASNTGALKMGYVFASDEYIEQVQENTGFSDQFAILLNGENIAHVPGFPDTEVNVYTINDVVNNEYFVYNNPRDGLTPYPDFEPDGFTKLLSAQGAIDSGWNTMRIGIVDVVDNHYDSWVFLLQGSFSCMPSLIPETPDTPGVGGGEFV